MTAKTVKDWLKDIGQSRGWLSLKCGVSKGTVNNWLSAGRPIPKSAQIIINGLMSGEKTILNASLTLQEFVDLQDIAKAKGVSIDDIIADLIRLGIKEMEAKEAPKGQREGG